MEETSEQLAARLRDEETRKERLEMLNRSPEEVAQASEDAKEPDFSPITAAEMRGTPVLFQRGGLSLSLKPLKRREIRDKFLPLSYGWPEVLLIAATVRNPACEGIDYPGTAALLSMLRYSTWKQQVEDLKAAGVTELPAMPGPVSQFDVADEVGALVSTLDIYLDPMCDTVWLLASGTPGILWPRPHDGEDAPAPDGGTWLDDYLDEHLELPDFADLLRALFAVNGGFKGSVGDRFMTASKAEE